MRDQQKRIDDTEKSEREKERANYIAKAKVAIETHQLAEFLWEMEQRLKSHGEMQIKAE